MVFIAAGFPSKFKLTYRPPLAMFLPSQIIDALFLRYEDIPPGHVVEVRSGRMLHM